MLIQKTSFLMMFGFFFLGTSTLQKMSETKKLGRKKNWSISQMLGD
jgi:hypothetical protein